MEGQPPLVSVRLAWTAVERIKMMKYSLPTPLRSAGMTGKCGILVIMHFEKGRLSGSGAVVSSSISLKTQGEPPQKLLTEKGAREDGQGQHTGGRGHGDRSPLPPPHTRGQARSGPGAASHLLEKREGQIIR